MANYKDEDWLRRQYWDNKNSISEVADIAGVSITTIRRHMDKNNIETRDKSAALEIAKGSDTEKYKDEAFLKQEYLEKEKSAVDIADELDCSPTTIYRHLRKYDIEVNSIEEATNQSDKMGWGTQRDHVRWQEFASFQTHPRDGYEEWYIDENGQKKHVQVHRLAGVAWFGFDSVADNIVHHNFPIPWLNVEWNLDTMSRAEHTKEHHLEGDFPQTS